MTRTDIRCNYSVVDHVEFLDYASLVSTQIALVCTYAKVDKPI
jgi:hypothetical protein